MLVFYFELTNIYIEKQKTFKEYILLFFLTFLAYGYLKKKFINLKKTIKSILLFYVFYWNFIYKYLLFLS